MEKETQLTVKKPDGIKSLMSNEMVKSKFAEILGKNANAFISSVTTLSTTTRLSECEPKSILSAAIAAASLNLQVTPTLGFAALVPYNSRSGKQAQFQIMAKGLIQLALRSGQFKLLNVTEIYDGEFQSENRLTGELDFTGQKKSDKVVGYAAYFELLNGFSKALYMTVESITRHGQKFSKSFSRSDSAWQTNFDGMARKTVLKLLLSRYAPLSSEMQSAISHDQAIITTGTDLEITDFTYDDNPNQEISPEELPAKSVLEIGTPAFDRAKKAIESGKTISDIEAQYEISFEAMEALTAKPEPEPTPDPNPAEVEEAINNSEPVTEKKSEVKTKKQIDNAPKIF